jgi:hypothetical protein
MERAEILDEIRRTAVENGGKPLGARALETATGIKPSDWGRFWPKISDAQREAGFEPNQKIVGYDDPTLFEKIIELTRELGKYPSDRDRRVKAHSDHTFPSHRVIERLGNRARFISKLAAYCADKPEYADVVAILPPAEGNASAGTDPSVSTGYGFVYLAKGHRGEYKIGRTNLVDRRMPELGVTASVEPTLVHTIKTDDQVGVEAYWHKRFEDKLMRGEWYKLSAADVKAFKRWRLIY